MKYKEIFMATDVLSILLREREAEKAIAYPDPINQLHNDLSREFDGELRIELENEITILLFGHEIL